MLASFFGVVLLDQLKQENGFHNLLSLGVLDADLDCYVFFQFHWSEVLYLVFVYLARDFHAEDGGLVEAAFFKSLVEFLEGHFDLVI